MFLGRIVQLRLFPRPDVALGPVLATFRQAKKDTDKDTLPPIT